MKDGTACRSSECYFSVFSFVMAKVIRGFQAPVSSALEQLRLNLQDSI